MLFKIILCLIKIIATVIDYFLYVLITSVFYCVSIILLF